MLQIQRGAIGLGDGQGIRIQNLRHGTDLVPVGDLGGRRIAQLLDQILMDLLKCGRILVFNGPAQIHQTEDGELVVTVALDLIPVGELIVHGQDQDDQRAVFVTQPLVGLTCGKGVFGTIDLLAGIGGSDLHSNTGAAVGFGVEKVDALLVLMDGVGVLEIIAVDQIQKACADILAGDIILHPVHLDLLLDVPGEDAQKSADLVQQIATRCHGIT